MVNTDPAALAAEAKAILAYLDAHRSLDPRAARPGILGELGVDQLQETLRWIVRIEAEDRGRARQRLTDPAFLAAELRWFTWDPPGATRDGWADLLRRVFGVDGWLRSSATPAQCGLPKRLRSVVIGAPATSRVIAGLLSARGPSDHEHHVEVRVLQTGWVAQHARGAEE